MALHQIDLYQCPSSATRVSEGVCAGQNLQASRAKAAREAGRHTIAGMGHQMVSVSRVLRMSPNCAGCPGAKALAKSRGKLKPVQRAVTIELSPVIEPGTYYTPTAEPYRASDW